MKPTFASKFINPKIFPAFSRKKFHIHFASCSAVYMRLCVPFLDLYCHVNRKLIRNCRVSIVELYLYKFLEQLGLQKIRAFLLQHGISACRACPSLLSFVSQERLSTLTGNEFHALQNDDLLRIRNICLSQARATERVYDPYTVLLDELRPPVRWIAHSPPTSSPPSARISGLSPTDLLDILPTLSRFRTAASKRASPLQNLNQSS